ncbi:469_t:CDS:1, partial [Acaulospora morrowiae]
SSNYKSNNSSGMSYSKFNVLLIKQVSCRVSRRSWITTISKEMWNSAC